MLDQLHSEIDRTEILREKARTIVIAATSRVREAVEATGDVPSALVLIAQAVEEDLAALTSEAFAEGVGFARERVGK